MALRNRRKLKRRMNRYMKHANYGKFFVDCRSHPCRVTEYYIRSEDIFGSYIDGTSLINGTGASCSCYYCAPEPVSKALAEEMAEFAKTHPWHDYLRKYHGYNDAAIAHYEELNKTWNFEEAGLDSLGTSVIVDEKE